MLQHLGGVRQVGTLTTAEALGAFWSLSINAWAWFSSLLGRSADAKTRDVASEFTDLVTSRSVSTDGECSINAASEFGGSLPDHLSEMASSLLVAGFAEVVLNSLSVP